MSALRFAALGDSLTEGIGDPVPGGSRGWAEILTASMGAGRPVTELVGVMSWD